MTKEQGARPATKAPIGAFYDSPVAIFDAVIFYNSDAEFSSVFKLRFWIARVCKIVQSSEGENITSRTLFHHCRLLSESALTIAN